MLVRLLSDYLHEEGRSELPDVGIALLYQLMKCWILLQRQTICIVMVKTKQKLLVYCPIHIKKQCTITEMTNPGTG